MEKFLSTIGISFELQMYIIIGVMFLLLVFCFTMLAIVGNKCKKLKKRVDESRSEENDKVVSATEKKSTDYFETKIDDFAKKNNELTEKIAELEKITAELEKKQEKCFDKVRVVRYISKIAGNDKMDFSVGLTNSKSGGFILTGTNLENGSMQLDVKTIKAGTANVELTEPEKCASERKNKNDSL